MATDASVDPNFTIVMRGYERDEVDAYLRDLVAETTRLGERVAQLEQELADSRAQSGGSPEEGFRALGEETTRILVAAETAAREMREKAERQADAELAAAEKAARERVETASAHADRIVAEAEGRQRDVEAEIQRLENVRAAMVDQLRGAIATTERAIAEAPSIDAEAEAPATASAAPATAEPAAEPFQSTAEAAEQAEEAAPADEPAAEQAATAEPEQEQVAEPEPEPVAPVPDDDAAAPVSDEPAQPTRSTAATAEAAPAAVPEPTDEEPHGGADRGALEAALAEADAAAGRAAPTHIEAEETDAGMLRERSLAGIRPGMLRRLRRSLQELQNGVLEAVRTREEDTDVDDLLPTDAEAKGLAEVARVFLDAGYRAGRADAPVLTGGEALQDPPTDTDGVAGAADDLAEEVLAELRTTLAPSLRAGMEADEPGASLSERVGEVFRDLKGPIIETVVDRHLTAMYGEATIAGLDEEGVGQVRWVLGEETRCPEGMCRANAAEGAVKLGADFPSGHAVPLAHEGCTCALEPA